MKLRLSFLHDSTRLYSSRSFIHSRLMTLIKSRSRRTDESLDHLVRRHFGGEEVDKYLRVK